MKFHRRIGGIGRAADEAKRVIKDSYLDVENQCLVATNGTILVQHYVSDLLEPGDRTGLVPIDAIKAAGKLKHGKTILDTSEIDRVAVKSLGVTTYYDRPAGRYPDYQFVLPRETQYADAITVTFDAALLYDLAQAMGRPDEKNRSLPVQLHIQKASGEDGDPFGARPIAVTFTTPFRAQAVGVLMPIADDGKQSVEIKRKDVSK